MKSILVYSPNPLDGVSFYRQWGPLSAMRNEYRISSFSNVPAELTWWTWYHNYDIALLSRPNKYNDLFFAQQCKKFGLPLWVDYDDALLEMPSDNPTFHTFGTPQAKNWITEVLKLADVITVCSELQKKEFEEKYSLKNVIYLPNALDDRWLKYQKAFPQGSKKVYWRGSDSHLPDLLLYMREIQNTVDRKLDHEFLFWGINPVFLQQSRNNKIYYFPFVNMEDFVVENTKYNARASFVVLRDDFFNRVKSNISWFDATLAGSVLLAPDYEGFSGFPGLRTFGKGHFAKEFLRLLDSSDAALEAEHKISKEYILDNLLLSRVNNTRREIINNL